MLLLVFVLCVVVQELVFVLCVVQELVFVLCVVQELVFVLCVVQETVKALKGYLEHAHQAHPMAAIFVLGTHRDVADKRAVDPPDKLLKVKYVFVSCACRVIHSYIIHLKLVGSFYMLVVCPLSPLPSTAQVSALRVRVISGRNW